jgi:hypothetical protein
LWNHAILAASTNFLSYLLQYCPQNACFIVFFDNYQSDVVQPDLLKSDGISWDSQPDTVMALTNLKTDRAKPKDKQYKLADERGMYLLVHPKGGKYWRFDDRIDGRLV